MCFTGERPLSQFAKRPKQAEGLLKLFSAFSAFGFFYFQLSLLIHTTLIPLLWGFFFPLLSSSCFSPSLLNNISATAASLMVKDECHLFFKKMMQTSDQQTGHVSLQISIFFANIWAQHLDSF